MIADVDECSNPSMNGCHDHHSSCQNTDGSYNCPCAHGFMGDGRSKCRGQPWKRFYTAVQLNHYDNSLPTNVFIVATCLKCLVCGLSPAAVFNWLNPLNPLYL